MKHIIKERISDGMVWLLRPLINLIRRREIKVTATGDRIKRNKKPFILISNHQNSWDSFIIMKHIKKRIRFVATEIAYLDVMKKILMSLVARTIKKRVGKPEFTATKTIFEYLKNGYSIGIFPEGDNTYSGKTTGIFENTGKFMKNAGVDIVLSKQQGGYLSQPRWADNFSKNGIVHTYTTTLLTKEELTDKTPSEINDIIIKALDHNDYSFQRKIMHNFKRKNRAEGIERFLYYCNSCGAVKTIYGEGHNIMCTSCGLIGTINEYEFIEGNQFDNLVDYNEFQYSHIKEVTESEFEFSVTLNIVKSNVLRNKKLGKYNVVYHDEKLTLTSKKAVLEFDLTKMKYPINTLRHSFSFDYEGIMYNFTDIRHQFVLYEMCRYLNGSFKHS